MLISQAFIATTTAFAFFSLYALFYSLYMVQLKFDDTSNLNLITQENSTTTWFQPKVKVVLVIIDAFRFDYLLNYKNIDHDPALNNHKLKEFNRAFYARPDKFVVLRANADAPTMTVLRVPCLMTGNVPRLGSVLTAFGAIPTTEDSVPRQLYLQNKKSYFSGDPILHEYFPEYFKGKVKVRGFNAADWTVDQPVQAYTNQKLQENKFDFLVAHLLRLDHMGHNNTDLRNHQVLNAIKDIDRFLVHLMNTIDDKTMLLFAGDHGMTKGGVHGGDSKQERHTAIVAYYKKGFKKYKQKNQGLKKIMRSVNETLEQVHQIDLVPTLSMLMGLPTPFSNIGQILNDLYPAGDYFSHHPKCPQTTLFDAPFDMQLLHDNYLNTLQVWNYFQKYHEGQSLFTPEEFANVTSLFQETEAIYKAAQELIRESHQCEDSFHKATIRAIEKSQQLSNEIHHFVNTKTPQDLVIFWQAFIILALVGVSYLLLVQYFDNPKDYEHLTWTPPKSWKSLIPILTLLTVIWTFFSPQIMRPLTTTVLVLALYIVGYSVVSLFSKPHEKSFIPLESSEIHEEKQQPPSFSLKSFFILQNPFTSTGAAIIIGYLFYLTHIFLLDKISIAQFQPLTPSVFALLFSARLLSRHLKTFYILLAAPFIFAITLDLTNIAFFSSDTSVLTMGLLLIGDWLWGEIQFARFKLKAGEAWSFQYGICFTVLVLYHLFCDPTNEDVKITLPRVIWAILIISSIAGFALEMPRKVIKRNLQVNLVLFLTLMQLHRRLLFFAIILSIMRVLAYLFKRAQFKNYLYPILMGFISYVGLFFNGFTDKKLPRNFEPAFVGIRDFHLSLCLFLYNSTFLSTIIIGILFISFYSHDLELQEVELGVEKEETDCQVVALNGHADIIKKRNILLFSFFFCLVMIGAAIDPVISQSHKKVYLSMERFLVDGVFYLFTISVISFMG